MVEPVPFQKPAPGASQEELKAAASVILERIQFMRENGISFNGARDLYEVLGYDRYITVRQYLGEYARGGIAKRIVEVLPNATWRGGVEIWEDKDKKNTAFEKELEILFKRLKLKSVLQRADTLAGIGNFCVLLIGVKEEQQEMAESAGGILSTPLPKGRGKTDDIIYFTPFLGAGGTYKEQRTVNDDMQSDCSVAEWETDISSPRFGMPKMYRLRRVEMSAPALMQPVHWSRVVHIAEGCLQDETFGIPTLESVWNLLMDLHKVTGGGAEAFWLRANQGMHLDIDKDMAVKDAEGEVTRLKAQADDYKNQITRWLRTRGVKVNTLGSDVANFNDPADAIITQICGSKGIPKRILTGSEMGELASSQDRENFKDVVVGRQENYAGPDILRKLVDHLVEYNYVPAPKVGLFEYQVHWSRTQALTEQERVSGAEGWARTNQAQGEVVFTTDEIRDKWEDMAPLTDEQRAAAVPPGAPANDPKLKQNQKTPEEIAAEKKKKEETPKTAEEKLDEQLMLYLAEAIEAGNQAVVIRLLGMSDAVSQ